MQQFIFELIRRVSGQENILAIPRLFIDLTGDIETAFFLSQVLYWTGKSKNKGDTFYKTDKEWKEELHLSEYKVRKARKLLINKGILEVSLKKADGAPTNHYKLNRNNFSEWILKELQNGNSKESNIETEETSGSLTETTTETTALKTRDNSKTEETKTDAEEYFDVREEVINEKKPRTTEEYQESIRETLMRVGDKVDSMSTEELAIASYVANIPDNMRGLAEAFCGVFGRPPAKGEDGFWRKGWNEQYEIGLKPVYVQRAYKKMMEEGLTVKSPGSVTAIADQLQREDKESTQDGTYFGANEVWDSEGKVYG